MIKFGKKLIFKLSEKKGTYVKLGKMKNPSMRIRKYKGHILNILLK